MAKKLGVDDYQLVLNGGWTIVVNTGKLYFKVHLEIAVFHCVWLTFSFALSLPVF